MIAASGKRWDEQAAERLSSLSREVEDILSLAPAHVRRRHASLHLRPDPVANARVDYDRRRARDAVFQTHDRVFAEPAWDMMLDLFIALAEGREVSATAACIGACAPPTTGLRCIDRLKELGLITERRHPVDRRVRLIELTPEGVGMMQEYLTAGT